jgi:hypothetical protein
MAGHASACVHFLCLLVGESRIKSCPRTRRSLHSKHVRIGSEKPTTTQEFLEATSRFERDRTREFCLRMLLPDTDSANLQIDVFVLALQHLAAARAGVERADAPVAHLIALVGVDAGSQMSPRTLS